MRNLNNYEIIAMKYSTNNHVPLRMRCNNFGDSLTFHTAIISFKIYAVPSASACCI